MQIKKFFNPLAILLSIFVFTSAVFASSDGAPRKIVVFKKSFTDRAAQHSLVKKHGAMPIKPLKIINGLAVYYSSSLIMNKRSNAWDGLGVIKNNLSSLLVVSLISGLSVVLGMILLFIPG